MRAKTLLKTTAVVAATAAVGSLFTRPDDPRYQRLEKPSWQPPPSAFPIVWTALYGLVAAATAQALDSCSPRQRPGLRASIATNLLLNAGWTAVFFGARAPAGALAEIAALNLSNADLLRRMWQADRRAAAAFAPYVVWTGFATALNADIVRRNRD